MSNFLWVAMGGALGAMGRYAMSFLPISRSFPYVTLLTNLLGALLIGFLTGWSEGSGRLSGGPLLFWKTGVCGGFTTFSTFSLESIQLMDQGKMGWAAAYMVASIGLCLLGVLAGRYLGMKIQRT